MKSLETPLVPVELTITQRDRIRQVRDIWALKTPRELRQSVGQPEEIVVGGKLARAVVWLGDPEARTNVLALSHQQGWKPLSYLRSGIFTALNARVNETVVVLPNNSLTDRYFDLTPKELTVMESRGLRPFYEQRTRTLEAIAKKYRLTGKWSISGYSLGGLVAPGIASVGSPYLDIVSVNSVEAPNKPRTRNQLRSDFRTSGKPSDQRRAFEDAHLPLVTQLGSTPRMLLDYSRFGLATFRRDNAAIERGMGQPNFEELLGRAVVQYDDLTARVGYVAGSKLFDPNHAGSDHNGRVILTRYEGPGTHLHATGDNPFAHAVMLSDRQLH